MRSLLHPVCIVSVLSCATWACQPPPDTAPRKIEVLFLGHESTHHDAQTYASTVAASFAREGINISYSNDPGVLEPATLDLYDVLLLYANHDSITASQEWALLDFVASGKGFVPVHSASFCFRNSDAFVELVGGQFLEHGVGRFTARIIREDHPAMLGLEEFETWDETYVHTRHSPDKTVLMERVDGQRREPWTWTRTHGTGRVFYTAFGHDERTWNHPGFQDLLKAGLLWAAGEGVRARWEALELPPLVYSPHDSIPNYEERDPPPRFQHPLSPEASRAHIQIPPGFELTLFASEPLIRNPIAMTWDERGRLFVLETLDYPHDLRSDGSDAIKILHDTDADGRADSVTIFAEGLSIATSLAFARGGLVVSQAPDMLLLQDTDGDDRADRREVLFKGFGTGDTHAGPSNLKVGFDNWIWGTVGYSDFEGVVGGDSAQLVQGVFRFRPGKLEQVTKFTNNTWGLGFSEAFDVFGSTANNEHSVFVAIPDRYYAGVSGLRGDGKIKIDGHYAMRPNTPNIRQVDVWGGFTSAAGHNLYTARDFPKEYWNRIALINEPTGHLLHRAVIEPDGSGFRERDGWNLLASADEWVSPVHAEVGPDGAVWILDWYNFIVQHNPTPQGFRTGGGGAHVNLLRDYQHGRIYRIAYEGAARRQMPVLDRDRPSTLISALQHDNMFWRMTAQRLLVERGSTDAVPALLELAAEKEVDAIGLNGAAVHALWTLHGLDAIRGDALPVVEEALRHPASGVRKAAMAVLPKTGSGLSAIRRAGVLEDRDLNVRLAAFLAASEMPADHAVGALLYEQSTIPEVRADTWLPEALYIAAGRHWEGFVAAYAADVGLLPFARMVARLATGHEEAPTDWSAPDLDTSEWGTMALPMPWVKTDALTSFDGAVWFRTEIDLQDAPLSATLGLGAIYDSDVTYVNGQRIGETLNGYDAARVYSVAPGQLRPGRNVVAVRVDDPRGRGGFWGSAEELFLRADGRTHSLATEWQFKVEEEYVGGKMRDLDPDTPIAEQFIRHHLDLLDIPAEGARSSAAEEPVQELALSVIPGALQFDKTLLTLPAGRLVRLRFTNPGDMPHNAVFTVPGAAEAVGLKSEKEAALGIYVPDTSAVLFATGMAEPGSEVSATFRSPHEAGDYPFLCTYPGHWRVMQGVLRITQDAADPEAP